MITTPFALFGLSDAGAALRRDLRRVDARRPRSTVWAGTARAATRCRSSRSCTGRPQRTAAHVGWLDRGVLAPGYLADLNVIDLDVLAAAAPTIVHDLPAGGRRLMQDADGYRYTVKSGAVTFEDGEHTGELPGGLVRGTQPPLAEARVGDSEPAAS